jgi:hypothetical protein
MIMGARYSPTDGLTNQAPLAAVAILPNRSLAQDFLSTLPEARRFALRPSGRATHPFSSWRHSYARRART